MSPVAYPPELRSAVVADYAAGMTFDEIAAARNLGATTVGNWVRASGTPIRPPANRGGRLCSVDDCDRKHYARGYCSLHHGRFVLGYAEPVNVDERLEDLRWMAETGEHLEGAADRLGIKVKAVEAFLRRYDRACLALLIAHQPKDHNRMISGFSIGQLTGQTERRRRRRQKVAA